MKRPARGAKKSNCGCLDSLRSLGMTAVVDVSLGMTAVLEV